MKIDFTEASQRLLSGVRALDAATVADDWVTAVEKLEELDRLAASLPPGDRLARRAAPVGST